MARARIVCIGNPYRDDDWVGPAVFAALCVSAPAPDVEVIDGGLHGLNLLPLLEGVERVIFADTLVPGESEDYLAPTVIADPGAGGAALSFDHAGGLAYLLRAAPLVLDALPHLWVVGAAAAAARSVAPALACIAQELAHGREHASR